MITYVKPVFAACVGEIKDEFPVITYVKPVFAAGVGEIKDEFPGLVVTRLHGQQRVIDQQFVIYLVRSEVKTIQTQQLTNNDTCISVTKTALFK